jgi:hypothetical protein
MPALTYWQQLALLLLRQAILQLAGKNVEVTIACAYRHIGIRNA